MTFRVSDPYSFDTDPDPGFLRPKIEKKSAEKKLYFLFKKEDFSS
jgi:hypothetical protein